MKLNNKQVFSQELVHKPIKNQIFHLRHVIVLHSFQVLCIYEFEKEQSGFFEIWRARHQQAYIKNDIQFAGQISRPFEYDEESIAFLDSQTAKLYKMHYLELGYLKQIQVDLPTQTFKDIMAMEIDDCIMEKYLMNCIQTQFVYDKKILIIEENLSVFEGPGGDVCDDTLFYSCLNSNQIGEAIIKKNREPLKFDVVDNKYVIIFRQNFFEEYLEFYVWDYFQKVEYSVPITVNINVNSCLLTCFLWNFEKFSKSEFDFIKQDPDNQQKIQINNLQIAFFANSNASKHPQIYFISFDTVLKQIYSFKSHSIILDQGGSMIIQVPWIFKQLQEVLIHYYTNDMKLQVSVYNIEKTKKFKVYHQSQDGFVSNLYYSRNPQCIVDHLYMQKEEDLMEEQFQEIKTQIKMEDKASIVQICFLPCNLILWHYLNKTKIIDLYGERLNKEVIDLIMNSIEVKQESRIKDEIKYEYIV